MLKLLSLALCLSIAAAAAQTPVILISIDTLRAGHLSAWGYKAISTPGIDAFAQHGTLFLNVNCQLPLTLPSHTSLFTSTYPFQNGVEENDAIVPPAAVTLATILQSRGYKTAAFIGSNLLARGTGFDRGFDDYDSPFGSAAAAAAGPYSTRVRRDGALVLGAATRWLAAHEAAHKDRPVFAFVHLFDLHAPYKLHSNPGSSLPAPAGYDAELGYVDRILGRFRQKLIDTGWWQRSIVVVVADHGESLGEHGESSHGYFAYESTVHVPLIIHWPDSDPAYPARSTKPAGLIDVAPTILDALHIPAPPTFEGTSLMKFDDTPLHPIYSEAVYARDNFRWSALRAIRLGDWKFIEAPHAELYNLAKDPREVSNVLRSNSAEATTLRAELTKLLARYKPAIQQATHDTSSSRTAALRSLGYLSGSTSGADTASAADPKDRLPEYQLFERSLDALYSRRVEAAIAGLRRVIAEDPRNLPARGSLGEAYFDSGNRAAAIREWKAAVAIDPTFAPAVQALAAVDPKR